MKKSLKNSWTFVLVLFVSVTAIASTLLVGCNKQLSPLNVSAVSKYEAKSYTNNDKIKYSYSYDGYDCYYIYLGEMANIPIYYQDAEYHSGVAFKYLFSTTTATTETITNTVTSSSTATISTTDTHTTSTTTGKKLSSEISSKISISAKESFLGVGESTQTSELSSKIGAENSWSDYVADSSSNGFQETTSLTDTVSHATAKTFSQTITKEYNLTKDDKKGYYRYTYFSASDIYLYVVKDSESGEFAYYEFKENVIPDVYFWQFDYSETPSFKKSDATSFEFNLDILENLPQPTITLAAPLKAPIVTMQPQSVSSMQAGGTSFTVKVSGNPAPTYHWQVNAGGGWSDLSSSDSIYSGVTSAALTLSNVPVEYNGYQYRCRISNTEGNVVSDPATLTVNSILAITAQPQNRYISSGQSTTFNITATGTPEPTYQWEVSTNGGISYNNITNSDIFSGATTATLSLTNIPPDYNGYKYRCVVTNTITATSTAATLNVIFETTPMIAAGSSHSIALKSDGTVWAWGNNDYGQLGDGTTTEYVKPVQVKGLVGVVAIATGNYHSVVLKWDGTVWAMGRNNTGQLGDGTVTNSNFPVQVKNSSGSGYLTDVVSIAAGSGQSVALKSNGSVWAWGSNTSGQLGDGTTTSRRTPVQVKDANGSENLTGVTAIAAGGSHTIALSWNGTVWTWGHNIYGQLGDGTTTNHSNPVQVKGVGGSGSLTGVTAIAVGNYHSIALKSDGTVWAWGHNYYSQLGDGSATNRSAPVQVKGIGGSGNLTGVTAIAARGNHVIALRLDGTALTFGYNGSGQLGDGTTTVRSTPVQVKDSGGSWNFDEVTAIFAGNGHTVALKSNDTVWAWGSNSSGELGDGTTINRTTPVQVQGGATGATWLNLLT